MVPLASIWVRCCSASPRRRGRRLWAHPPQSLTVGLCDIGTTYSCVATYEGSNVEIIANEQGSFTTPSFVSFTDQERLIGEAAKNQAAMNPTNTVFDVKLVPRKDPHIQEPR